MPKKTTWDSYDDYLKSDQWAAIRDQVHTRDEYCQVCGKTKEEIEEDELTINCHHWRYSPDWSDDDMSNVVLVCSGCHTKIHENDFKCTATTYTEYLIAWFATQQEAHIEHICKLAAAFNNAETQIVAALVDVIVHHKLSVRFDDPLLVTSGKWNKINHLRKIRIIGCPKPIEGDTAQSLVAALEESKYTPNDGDY